MGTMQWRAICQLCQQGIWVMIHPSEALAGFAVPGRSRNRPADVVLTRERCDNFGNRALSLQCSTSLWAVSFNKTTPVLTYVLTVAMSRLPASSRLAALASVNVLISVVSVYNAAPLQLKGTKNDIAW